MSAGTNFRTIQRFKIGYAPCAISQYVSDLSGLQVIVVDRKGPKIEGHFALATEIFDDSGAPHTLEHLIFLGSQSYQYKGLLDKLCSRAYSITNASTKTDHTVYTLETAGWEGFAQVLPVYLEHIILPTITDEGIVTEVCHIDGEGNDAGVVYSEMQGLQSQSSVIMVLMARPLLYEKNVGFRYETGGMTEALRVLTPERIRQFHRDMYQPRNLCLVIIGEADHENLLQTLDKFEESVKQDIPLIDTPFQRPWIDSAQPSTLNESAIVTAEFPEEDETVGEILVAFFGPNCIDMTASSALKILLTYLCSSSISILKNVMIEREKVASSIFYQVESRPNSVIWLKTTGVATEKLGYVEKRIFELLNEVASNSLDMEYMRECIRRERRRVKYQAETSESFYATNIIIDHIFGERDGSTLKDLQNLNEYDDLEKWEGKDWCNFLRKWMSDAHHISVLGKPSLEMASKMKKDEEARIAKRKEELGPEGLAKLGKHLEEAKKKNNAPIPASLIDQWPVPGTDSIHFIESDTARAGRARAVGLGVGSAQKFIDAAPNGKLPLFLQFEDVPTNFVHIAIHIGTSQIPDKFKPLMPIFKDNFFKTHILRNGKQVGFEQIIMKLERDTINYRLSDTDGMMIHLTVEPEKYHNAVEWIHALMFASIFDPQRLETRVTKALADIPERKRNGEVMANEIDAMFHMEKSTLAIAECVLVRAVYLKRLKKLLETKPEKVVSWFNTVRESLFTFQNMRFLVTANLATLPDPLTTWDTLSKSLTAEEDMVEIPKPVSLLNAEGRNPGSVGAVIIPMTTLDSSYSVSSAKGLESFSDPLMAALVVAIGYLDAPEGPLWNAVRGAGYAYHSSFASDINSGRLSYTVHSSPDAFKAIAASSDAIRKIAEGEVEIDRHLLEGAIGQIVLKFANEQSTMHSAAQQNFVQAVVHGLPRDWNKEVLRRVRAVTIDEMRAAMRDIVLPCFEPGKSNIIVTCAISMKEGMEIAFKGRGYNVQTRELNSFHGDLGLKPDGDEEAKEDGNEGELDGAKGSCD